VEQDEVPYLLHLSGPSRVIKFLYSPAPPLPTSMGPETSLVPVYQFSYLPGINTNPNRIRIQQKDMDPT
jgi:hypothetical protein